MPEGNPSNDFSSALASGDPAVGKTALVQMFRSDGTHFQKNYTLVSWGGRVLSWPLCNEMWWLTMRGGTWQDP